MYKTTRRIQSAEKQNNFTSEEQANYRQFAEDVKELISLSAQKRKLRAVELILPVGTEKSLSGRQLIILIEVLRESLGLPTYRQTQRQGKLENSSVMSKFVTS